MFGIRCSWLWVHPVLLPPPPPQGWSIAKGPSFFWTWSSSVGLYWGARATEAFHKKVYLEEKTLTELSFPLLFSICFFFVFLPWFTSPSGHPCLPRVQRKTESQILTKQQFHHPKSDIAVARLFSLSIHRLVRRGMKDHCTKHLDISSLLGWASVTHWEYGDKLLYMNRFAVVADWEGWNHVFEGSCPVCKNLSDFDWISFSFFVLHLKKYWCIWNLIKWKRWSPALCLRGLFNRTYMFLDY